MPALRDFTVKPESMDCVTMVVCSHQSFGTVTYYFTVEEYQHHFYYVTSGEWVNGFTITLIPCKE